jgi:hypothetical protein
MKVQIIQFAATIPTALALVPVGAHVLELPNKIHLAQAQYVAVQQIYRGWALLGIVLIAALLANLLSAIVAQPEDAGAVRCRCHCFARRHTRGLLHMDIYGQSGDRQLDRGA